MRFSSRCVAMTGVLVLSNACVARPSTEHRPRGASGSSSSLVTSEELARYASGANLFDALQRLRPTFLYPRGSRALVSIDGTAPSDLSVLSLIPVSTVAEVRLVRATSAASRPTVLPNGDVVFGDVLFVVTRK